MKAIKIISVPAGEAPLEVREGWVGIVLPLAMPGKVRTIKMGVLSGPKNFWSVAWFLLFGEKVIVEGYAVDGPVAINRLEQHHPEAAEWWKAHTSFHKRKARLVFGVDECEVMDDVVWPPPPRSDGYSQ